MTEGRVPVRVASPPGAVVARAVGVVLVLAGAVTGLVVHVFWTWLLSGIVAGMLGAPVVRMVARAGVGVRRAIAGSRPPAVAEVQAAADPGELFGVQLDGRERLGPVVPRVRLPADQPPDVREPAAGR
jgi:hypothetical protein